VSSGRTPRLEILFSSDAKKEGDYRRSNRRKTRRFRAEAVRAGFRRCHDTPDYRAIVDVAARLPEQVIQGHEKLLMYYGVAAMRLGSA
jgi:hypothetical protein